MTNRTPAKAWEKMVRGNERFVSGEPRHPRQDVDRRAEVAPAQFPHAALFGCSDSRLAAEIIFDKGLGDLFVVRNAGQVISESVVGSLEYAVGVLQVPLIVVLGHDECGAVRAAIDSQGPDAPALSPHITTLISPILPAVRRVAQYRRVDPAAIDAQVVGLEHLRDTISEILESSEMIREGVAAGTLAIVGANYQLLEGKVVPDITVGLSDSPPVSDRNHHRFQRRTQGEVTEYRIEHDTMGEVRVPANALYGAQTQRAVENFPISGDGLEPAQIIALARIKRAAAIVNGELGIIDSSIAQAIVAAADTIIDGNHLGDFPIDVYQTGSGTSSNMNMNEVLARLASESLGSAVHPNDHVNASQSSNDVFPTSVHLAVTSALLGELIPSLEHLAVALETKAELWKSVVKSGRTHLMDATPVTLGQEFAGYARQMRLGIERVQSTIPRVAEVPLGGTATGTGINTPLGFPQRVISELAANSGLPITEAVDHFEAQGARDGLVEASGALRVIAVSLTKICNDLRWMGSGPNTGLAELHIPDLQPGSSIMPGKVNPVVPEAVLMVCARVIGNDATIAWSGASGNFELNVAIPVMGTALLESIRLLASSTVVLADKTVEGLVANEARAKALAESSPSIVTPLNKIIGYESAAKIAKHSVAEGLTVREAVIDLGFVERGEVTLEQLDEALDVMSMTHPG